MVINYTKHALKKFKGLEDLGVYVSKKLIKRIIQKPIHLEDSDCPKKIASGTLDDNHILRVVYKIERDIIVIITFYPLKRGGNSYEIPL